MVETVWFNDFKTELPRVDGKVFVITGTTSGTGYVAARTAAELGGEAVLLNRPSERARKSMEKLKAEVPNGKFSAVDCDLQNFGSVRQAAKQIKDKYKSLYAVCWNAGIMATPDRATVDGYDEQMQTNHLSHFLLTAELFELIEKSSASDPRIVNHSSGARRMTPNGLERKYLEKNGGNLGGNSKNLEGFSGPEIVRYANTKLANAVFTKALHKKLQASGSKIRAICADPGVSSTNLGDHLVGKLDFASMVTQTSEDGSMGIIKGMLHPDAKSGVHYGPLNLKGPVVEHEAKPYETNPESLVMLWETSEAATGVKFAIPS